MGRTIPSVSTRLEAKLSQWEHFARLLPPHEREAFLQIASDIRNRRSAIDAADEPDIGLAMLLAALVSMKSCNHKKGDLDDKNRHSIT